MESAITVKEGENIIIVSVSDATWVGLKDDPLKDFLSYCNFTEKGTYQVEFQALLPKNYYVSTDGIINSISGASVPVVSKEPAKTKSGELLVYSPFLAQYDPKRQWQCVGQSYTVECPTPPDTFKVNIFDFCITSEIAGGDHFVELIGGRYLVLDPTAIHEEDYIDFSVVDKNDVLGLFGKYGLIPGQDVLELVKYIRTHSIIGGQIVEFKSGTQSSLIPEGLFLRAKYVSHGSKNFSIKVDYFIPR